MRISRKIRQFELGIFFLFAGCFLLSVTVFNSQNENVQPQSNELLRNIKWHRLKKSNQTVFELLFADNLHTIEYNQTFPYPWRQIDEGIIYKFNLSTGGYERSLPKDWHLDLRRQQVQQLKEAIKRHYVARVTRLTTKNSRKFLLFECTFRGGDCAGFGNRVMGLVGVLYAAIGLGRNFGINWDHYMDINEFFNFSGISIFNKKQIEGVEYHRIKLLNGENEDELAKWLANSTVPKQIKRRSHVFMSINSLVAIESTFKNPAFRSRLMRIFKHLLLDFRQIDGSVVISAALQLVFSHPTKRLNYDYKKCLNFSKNSFKIGIHIRFGDGGKDNRVSTDEVLRCFPLMIADIVRRKSSKWHNFDLFLAADRDGKEFGHLFSEKIGNLLKPFNVNWRLFTTKQTCPQYEFRHSDWGKDNFNITWNDEVKTYLEWLALTRMDFLILTKSTYGEMAALKSLKPAVRFREKKWLDQGNVDYCSFHHFNLWRAGFRFD